MKTQLSSVAVKAKLDKRTVFTSLAHLLTPTFLKETWKKMNKKGAPGIDKETMAAFAEKLEERVQEMHEQLRAGKYYAPPVRRVEIPKDGAKTRLLGIPTVSDRLLQAAVARILNAVFEPVFLNSSWGYRPKRDAHGAIGALRSHIIAGKVMQVYEADIRAYFDRVNHDWLRQFLKQKIADPVILRLVDKWLRAGIMSDGLKISKEDGVPQGGPVSCILANVYLHYVLDLWFEKKLKASCNGEAHLVRYVDDFVACFQYERDAIRFGKELKERFQEFHLELAEEKTRSMPFGRFARERGKSFNQPVGKFDFLGFAHICGTDHEGKFVLIRKPRQKSCRKFLDRVKEWLKRHPHYDVWDQQRQILSMLRGFYQYYALTHCVEKLNLIRLYVRRCWRFAIRRKSQRTRSQWGYLDNKKWFEMPYPQLLHANI
ncbi:group II intron reverse transcriptase/maturase [Mucilaginibacter sabulilitoris]|uniref:Group II intron reverse transcriptase/maturase n=1 Tax=Mucilaginibacter sabulilitoris TaxID=1173583 RepID=A0ABZ0TH47_9SPHI|nr:group II intron reverse transcriptase/maturase [Mucilaginibacter sabulilitoris]WPU90905.1 group II intron reverse transcriptase/maturase [Mucilaginibacter sabulilitoris]WPU94854.1 group II intron reverse transcriptase/maturase [Mucilaginibacter sabulilitoris]